MNLGTAYVNIKPDTRGFRSQLRREVTAAVSSLRPTVRIGSEVDTSGLRRQVTAAVRTAGFGQKIKVGLDVEGGGGIGGIGRQSRDATNATNDLGGSLRKLAAGWALVKGSSAQLKLPVLINGIAAAGGAVGVLSAGAIGLAGSLSQVAGVMPAVATGASAVGQGFGVVKLASIGMGDAMKGAWEGGEKGAKKMEEALEGMDPSARALVATVIDLKGPILELRNVAQAGLFPGVIEGLNNLRPLFGQLTPAISGTAMMMGALANEASKMLVSMGPKLASLMEGNIGIIRSLGLAFINVIPGVLSLLSAAQPLAQWLADLALQGSKWVTAAIQGGEASGKLAGFFERVRGTVTTLGHIFRDLGVTLFKVFSAARPLGDWMLRAFEEGAAKLRALTSSVQGQNSLARFFESAKGPLTEVGRLIVDVGKGIGTIAGNNAGAFGPFVAQLRTELLPALIEVFSTIDGRFLSSLVSLAAGIARLLGAFGTATPLLTSAVGAFAMLANGAASLVDALGPVGDLLAQIVGILSAIGFAKGLLTLYQGFSLLTGGGVLGGLRVLTGQTDQLGRSVGNLEGSAGKVGLLGRALGIVGLVAGAGLIAVDQWKAGAEQAGEKTSFWERALLGIPQGLSKLSAELGITSAAQDRMSASAQNLAGVMQGGIQGALGYEQSQLRLQSSLLSVQSAQQGVNDATATYGPQSFQAAQAANQLSQAELALKESAVAVAQAQAERTVATFTGLNADQQATATAQFFKEELLNQAAAIGGPVGAALSQLANSFGATVPPAVTAENAALSVGSAVRAIPPNATTNVTVNTAQANTALSNFIAKLRAVDGQQATAFVKLNSGIFRSSGGPVFAHGGPVTRAALGRHLPGYGGGDRVPVMAEAGEFVWRKEIVRKLGPKFFSAVNAGATPALMRSGGAVEKRMGVPSIPLPAYRTGGQVSPWSAPRGGSMTTYNEGDTIIQGSLVAESRAVDVLERKRSQRNRYKSR